ncbi:MAG: heat shock protein HspQ [Gammaproteobacteria bacterium]|jgi:heat shock protein HspQ|tara:strand:+ start:165 stop:509 length:345 start_codon:yes stop_codon:yes gene_type:complete
MDNIKQELVETKFAIGAVVKHRFLDFRGVIFDVDPEFNNTEEWYESIPASIRPKKNQPFYHLFAENGHIFYVAYVSEQNLLDDASKELPKHPEIKNLFSHFEGGKFVPLSRAVN